MKRIKTIPWGLLLVLVSLQCWSQDTVNLEPVLIQAADPSRYLPGGVVQELSMDTLYTSNLGAALEAQTAAYIIQYGAEGQLGSLNLRGLGAARSLVQWHGISINSFTLGQSDFGAIQIPKGYHVALNKGAVSSLFGSGALGGNLSIEHQPSFKGGLEVWSTTSVGSFGRFEQQNQLSYSNKKWASYSSFLYKNVENNFTYELDGAQFKQNNAAFESLAFMQDFYWLPSTKHSVSGHFWWSDFTREIQPHLEDFTANDHLDTENLRAVLKWNYHVTRFQQEVAVGFTSDNQIFNSADQVLVKRAHFSWSGDWKLSDQLSINGNTVIDHLRAEVDAYETVRKETRSNVEAALLWSPKEHWQVGFSTAIPFLNEEIQSITPLASIKKEVLKRKHTTLFMDIQFGRSYRLPTLNDRYWRPGGNPNLKAESAWNTEIGVSYHSGGTTKLRGGLHYFNHQVNDWILWIPGGREVAEDGSIVGFWFPSNIREVSAQGVELHQSWSGSHPTVPLSWRLDLNATYQRVQNKNQLSAVDRSRGQQLPYTPKFLGNYTGWINYQQWSLIVDAQYASKRYVEANNELPALEAYWLAGVGLQRSGAWGTLSWTIKAQVHNLLDQQYQTFENRAMPGRNYQLNLTLHK